MFFHEFLTNWGSYLIRDSMQLNHMHLLSKLPDGSLPTFYRRVVGSVAVLDLASSEDEGVRLFVSHINTDFVVDVRERPLGRYLVRASV